jgi:hypothetical protein
MAHIRSSTQYDGLDSRSDEHWSKRAACRDEPDMWSDESTAVRRIALHICLDHCTVYAQCAALKPPEGGHRSIVIGGQSYGSDGRPMPKATPVAVCHRCRQPKPGDQHGTVAGALRHRRRKEPLCFPCRVAEADRSRRQRAPVGVR